MSTIAGQHVTGAPEHDMGAAVYALRRLVEVAEHVTLDQPHEFAVRVSREVLAEHGR